MYKQPDIRGLPLVRVLHTRSESNTQEGSVARLPPEVERLHAGEIPIESWQAFGTALHQAVVGAEREMIAEGLSPLDVDLAFIEVGGKRHRRVISL